MPTTTANLAYSTTTGDTRPYIVTGLLRTRDEVVDLFVEDEAEPHCYICNRHTDHFAEHDDMVEQGLARYGSDGSVFRIGWV